jgi:hypothetical protein
MKSNQLLAHGGGSRSKLLLALRSTKLDKVFTYGIVVTQGNRFTHLGMAADGGGGWR